MRNSQSPSIHAVYHNALPFYLDRADLNSVSEEGGDFGKTFIDLLLKGEVTVQFDASAIALEKVRHLFFEAKNLSKTLGAKTFGLGYPMLIDTYEGELTVAPIFIWQLSLEPAQTKINAWVLKFDKQHLIQPNYHIIRYIKDKYDIDYETKYLDAVEGNVLSYNRLSAFVNELVDRFYVENIVEEGNLMDAPGIDEIGEYAEKGAIHWSGVLGIFPPQNKKWSGGTIKPEDVFTDRGDLPIIDPFIFPFLATDPEQITAQELAMRKGCSIVEGVDALGKSQTLLNVLLSALMQGKKTLVVSERAPALKRAQDLLAKSGINQLNFLLTDANNDQDQFLELLKVAAKGASRDVNFDETDFQFKKNKYLREKVRLEETYSSVKRPLFGTANWTDTVGLFLANNRKEGKELLANHLNRNDFSFKANEHELLKDGIETCYPLFAKIKTLNHPLSDLNDRIFQQVAMEDGQSYLEDQLEVFLDKTRRLHNRYIVEISTYRSKLKNHYDEYLLRLEMLLRQENDKLLSYKDQLGKDFLDAKPSSFRLPIFFSKKKKKIQAAQIDVAKGYRALKKAFEEKPYFEFEFPTAKDGMLVKEVMESLVSFDVAFSKWKRKLDDLSHEETVRLNSKTAHPSLGIKEEVSQLEYALDVMLEEMNEAYLYQKLFENKTLTITKRQKYLESVIEQMETTRLYLSEFPQFYQWQSEWLKLGPIGQKVVNALVKVKPKNWTAAFESWYFYNMLLGQQSSALPTSLSEIISYDENYHALKPLLLNRIAQYWQTQQQDSLKSLKKANKGKYQDIFEKPFLKRQTTRKPLEELLEGSMDAVTAFLPILFVSPHVVLNVLPGGFKFDLVIFEESNRFSVEPASDIASLGKQVVIFGSNDSNGNESSLLQYALENGVPLASITNRYEAPIPFLSSILPATHAFHFAQACSVESLEGRFHETDGTNDFEAQHVIRILNQIKQTPQRVYPSVGIVAFTIEQRDLIAAYILKLKQQNAIGSEKIRHLERNGLGVFYVEELFGQQFDVLVVSCTFGTINIKGKLTKRLALLNTDEGISYMHLLINKPLQKLYLLHSFTEEHLDEFKGKQWDTGTWLLAHFIKMTEAAEQQNEIKFLEQMEVIGKKEQRLPGNNHFIEEVADALKAYVDPDRFCFTVPRQDVVLPLVIKPIQENAPEIALHPDGFFADTPFTSGVWEQAHLNRFASSGLEVIPVWSVNWLKDPAQEARKLASLIIKIDGTADKVHTEDEKSPDEINPIKKADKEDG